MSVDTAEKTIPRDVAQMLIEKLDRRLMPLVEVKAFLWKRYGVAIKAYRIDAAASEIGARATAPAGGGR